MAVPESGPYVQVACFCERVLHERDGVLSAIRIVDRFFVPLAGDQPAGFSAPPFPGIQAVLLVVLKAGRAEGTHPIHIQLERPDGLRQDVASVDVLFERDDRGVNIALPIGFQPEQQGLHWFDVKIGDVLLTRMSLRVVFQSQQVGGIPPPTPSS
jgi:hypothetical protein